MSKVVFVLDKIDNGGLQKVNAEIANILSEDYDVEIFTLEKKKPYFKVDSEIKILTPMEFDRFYNIKLFFVKSVNLLYKKIFQKSMEYRLSFQLSYLKKYIKSDVGEVVLSGFSILFVDELKKSFPNIRFIMWMHSNANVYLNTYFKYEYNYLISSMKSADKLIVLNTKDKKEYENYSENVVLIPNPVTIKNDNKKSQLNSKNILIVSRIIVFAKGLDYLVEIATKIPDDWKINLIGGGNKSEIRKLKKLIKKSNVEDKLVLIGAKTSDELVEYYANASIYLSTSRWEGFGLVLVEAMQFGLPILSFRHLGAIDILENGRYGMLVNQGDVEQFADYLNQLILNENMLHKMQTLSLERVNKYSPNKIKSEWKNMILEK